MIPESWIEEILDGLRSKGLERRIVSYPSSGGKLRIGDRDYLSFSSNDYLDFANHAQVVAAAAEALRRYGAGAASSRLVAGSLPIHNDLEARIAAFKGYPASLLFGSGHMANSGVISTLVGRDDTVFADRLAHASILDAATLSRAKLVRFEHNDIGHLDELLASGNYRGHKLVVTESLFSMDGDLAPLRDIVDVAARHNAMLMVDEAHATGVFGASGCGLVRELGLERHVDISMGTLSKALGSYGGFAACSEKVRELLVNRSRALIYSTAPPPAAMGAALGALNLLAAHPALPTILLRNAAMFRGLLVRAGLNVLGSESQIVPILVGDNEKALSLSRRLRERGILANAIRPPTVPPETARIRFSLTLAHSEEDLARAANIAIAEAKAEKLL